MGPAQKAVAAQINRDFASAFHAEMLHQIVLRGQPQPLSAAAQAHLAVRTEIEPRFHLADGPVIAVPQFGFERRQSYRRRGDHPLHPLARVL